MPHQALVALRLAHLLRVQHDEVECVGFELFGAVDIGETEDVAGDLHGEVLHQLLLAHRLQPLQLVLQEKGKKP